MQTPEPRKGSGIVSSSGEEFETTQVAPDEIQSDETAEAEGEKAKAGDKDDLNVPYHFPSDYGEGEKWYSDGKLRWGEGQPGERIPRGIRRQLRQQAKAALRRHHREMSKGATKAEMLALHERTIIPIEVGLSHLRFNVVTLKQICIAKGLFTEEEYSEFAEKTLQEARIEKLTKELEESGAPPEEIANFIKAQEKVPTFTCHCDMPHAGQPRIIEFEGAEEKWCTNCIQAGRSEKGHTVEVVEQP